MQVSGGRRVVRPHVVALHQAGPLRRQQVERVLGPVAVARQQNRPSKTAADRLQPLLQLARGPAVESTAGVTFMPGRSRPGVHLEQVCRIPPPLAVHAPRLGLQDGATAGQQKVAGDGLQREYVGVEREHELAPS